MINESGFYLIPGKVRSYAPCGDRPVLHPFLTRDHLSVTSGVTPEGQLYTHTSNWALESLDAALFLEHLLELLGCPLLVLWDGLPIHRGDVDAFLAQVGSAQILVERLPDYAPDLNPDEGVWNYLKHVELRNDVCLNLRSSASIFTTPSCACAAGPPSSAPSSMAQACLVRSHLCNAV